MHQRGEMLKQVLKRSGTAEEKRYAAAIVPVSDSSAFYLPFLQHATRVSLSFQYVLCHVSPIISCVLERMC